MPPRYGVIEQSTGTLLQPENFSSCKRGDRDHQFSHDSQATGTASSHPLRAQAFKTAQVPRWWKNSSMRSVLLQNTILWNELTGNPWTSWRAGAAVFAQHASLSQAQLGEGDIEMNFAMLYSRMIPCYCASPGLGLAHLGVEPNAHCPIQGSQVRNLSCAVLYVRVTCLIPMPSENLSLCPGSGLLLYLGRPGTMQASSEALVREARHGVFTDIACASKPSSLI